MILVYSKNKVPIRLTQERWQHITMRHPELESQKVKVEETISHPDCIQQGDFGELLAIRLYASTPFAQKYMVVAYKETSRHDGFILTAYFTNEFSKRRLVLWKC